MAAPDLARHPTSKLSHGRTLITQLETEPSAYVQSYLAAAGPPTEMYMDALRSGGSLNILPYGRKGHWPERRFEQSLAKVMAPQPLINHPQTVSAPSIGKHAADRQVLTEPAVGRHNVSKKTALVPSASMPAHKDRDGDVSVVLSKNDRHSHSLLERIDELRVQRGGAPKMLTALSHAGAKWLKVKQQGVASIAALRVLRDDTLQGASRGASRDRILRPLLMRKELLKLSASAPNWWKMPETSVEAAERFDTKHRARSARADQLCILSRKATSPRDALALKFDEALFAVRTNRYFELRPVAPAEKVIPRARRPKEGKVIEPKPFDVYKSIWEPRRKDADSRDVYDTDEVEFNRFSIDWEELLRLGITKLILMHDDGGDDGVEDEDGDGIPDEVEDVGMVLWKVHDVLSSIYTYYSIQSGSISDGIGLNAWTDFTDDFNLVSKTSQFCQRKDVDLIFIEVNAKSKLAARELKKQPSTRELAVDGGGELSLSRLEFYQALVRLAICKYVKGGEIPDVSDAVERLVSTDIMNRAIALESRNREHLVVDANLFRARYAYTKPVCTVLEANLPSLETLYDALCNRSYARMKPRGSKDRLAVGEWLGFLYESKLIGQDISERDAMLCFAFSRMVVVDTRTEIGKRRDAMIQFQGFMEALCRASTLKALPTAAELKAAGCDNAPQWIEENHDKYMAILSTRGTPWGIDPVRPVEESLQMVLDIVHHAVAKTTSSAQAGDISVRSRVVSTEQAMRFVTKLKGRVKA